MLFNYQDAPVGDGDSWYFPRRHDVFLYDPVGLNVTGRNPDLLTYIPDSSNENYRLNYSLPSFSCISAQSRKTNSVPNGSPPSSGDNPYSGIPNNPRLIAVTPAHGLVLFHYPIHVDSTAIFYSLSGDFWQKVKIRKSTPVGSGFPHGENQLVLLEFQAARENYNPSDNDSEYNTTLGDSSLAPNVNIKYPKFMPQVGPMDPIGDYIFSHSLFVIDQDIRCGLTQSYFSNALSSFNETNFLCSVRVSMNYPDSDEIEDWNEFYEQGHAIPEDIVSHETGGDSGSPYFINIPEITKDNGSPILVGLLSGGSRLINQSMNLILPEIEKYDSDNGTGYATDFSNRILTRSELGILDLDFSITSIKKIGFESVDLKPIWENIDLSSSLTVENGCNSIVDSFDVGIGGMIDYNHGFIIDPSLKRVVNFNFNNQYELSWTESEWVDGLLFTSVASGENGNRHFTTFENEIYMCNLKSAGSVGSTGKSYPEINPGQIAKFRINNDNTISVDGFLFDIGDNPEEFMGASISSNSRELFVSAGTHPYNNDGNDYLFADNKVVVFLRENNKWNYKQTIQYDGYEPSDEIVVSEMFGHTLECSDEWLFISDNEGLNPNQKENHIYVFKKNSNNGVWEETQKIDQPDPLFHPLQNNKKYNFGNEIIINNNTLIVSGEKYQHPEIKGEYGAAFLYTLDPITNQWNWSNEIDFDYKTDMYDAGEDVGAVNFNPPLFSKSMSIKDDFLAIAAPRSVNGLVPSHITLDTTESIGGAVRAPSGIVSIYKKDGPNKFEKISSLDTYSDIGHEFGSFINVSPTYYDEYGRIKGRSILALEKVTSSEDISNSFSGGEIIIQAYQYNTFPIDKSNSNLRGLGQSFNTKLIPAHTKTIPFINTSSSPNRIVALPLDIHPAYSAVFEKYTKLSAPNKKAIHILIQDDVNETEVAYLRNVLSKILSNKDGSLYGSNKTAIFNSMSNEELIIGIFRNSTSEDSSDTTFLTGEFNINIEIINQDNIDMNVFLKTNETIGMLTEATYTYGIFKEDPSMKSALNAARVQAEGIDAVNPTSDFQFSTRTGSTNPESFSISQQQTGKSGIFYSDLIDQEEKNVRYLRLGVEVYYGMWDHDPNATGKSGDNEYNIISKDQMQEDDPGLFNIVNGFFPEDISVY